MHIREKLRTPRRLGISLKSCQCLLLHYPARLVIVDVAESFGNSEFPYRGNYALRGLPRSIDDMLLADYPPKKNAGFGG